MMNVKIIPVMEHFEAYENGLFLCSGDTFAEILQELWKEENGDD